MAKIDLISDVDFPVDASVGGSERICAADVTTAKHLTPDLLSAYTIVQIEAISAVGTHDSGDSIMVLENGTSLKPCTYAVVQQAFSDTMWGKSNETVVDNADDFLLKDGGSTEKIVTAAVLATYMLATNRTAILNISNLSEIGTLVDTTEFLVADGSTPKKTDFIDISNGVNDDFQAYAIARPAVSTTADADIFYTSQSGTAKKVTLAQIVAHFAPGNRVLGPGNATVGYIPRWIGGNTLEDGMFLATSFSAGSNTALATSKAIRDEMDDIIYDATAIGAAIVDADTILINDGDTATTQKKATMAEVWTWIQTSIQGLSAKAVAVDADILTIQDSADSNTLKELTMANMWVYSVTKIQGLADKATPLSADILTIQDSADSNNLKEMTITNMMKALDIDGLADLGAPLQAVDLVVVDDGAGGTNRKCAISRIATYICLDISTNGLSVGDQNITNVGNIALDSISKDGSGDIVVSDQVEFQGTTHYFGGAKGQVYTSSDNLNFNWSANSDIAGHINWVGYQGGTTQFRDLNIYDGKQNLIALFDGSTKKTTFYGEVRMSEILRISERVAADGSIGGYGQLWVKNTVPCELWFTDDTGTDTQIV